MTLNWLAHDTIALTQLPDWARVAGQALPESAGSVCSQGLVFFHAGGRASALRWEEMLGVARGGGRCFLLAARRPPTQPWFELREPVMARVEQVVTARESAGSERYRAAPTEVRQRLEPQYILRAVLARHVLPGSIEVPVRKQGMDLFLDGIVTALTMDDPRIRRRVLVMTPDAFVAGLGGPPVRAIAWEQVGGFRPGHCKDGNPALEVIDQEGVVRASVAAAYFAIDLSVLIALAEAYRARVNDHR